MCYSWDVPEEKENKDQALSLLWAWNTAKDKYKPLFLHIDVYVLINVYVLGIKSGVLYMLGYHFAIRLFIPIILFYMDTHS